MYIDKLKLNRQTIINEERFEFQCIFLYYCIQTKSAKTTPKITLLFKTYNQLY